MKNTKRAKTVNIGRHKANCAICAHPDREEIEREFVEWASPAKIAIDHGLSGRMPVYRHARAFGLLARRERNIRAALAKIIEKAGDVEATAQSVVAAVQAYSKINAAGHWIERTEHINLNELFERMTRDELEKYAQNGTLPAWFAQVSPVTEERDEEFASD
jgi:hypothetical protein